MQNKRPFLYAVILISGLLSAVALAADSKSEAKAKLSGVVDTVKTQQAELKASKMSRKELLAMQEKAAKSETEISQALFALNNDLVKQGEKLATLTTQQQQESENQKDHIAVLVAQLRAIQQQTQPNYLQALLSQNDPSKVARGLTYYRYFHQARVAQMAEITDKLTAITEKKKAIASEQIYYQTLIDSQKEKQQTLAAHNAERNIVVAALDTKIASQGAALSVLQAQQKKLQNLVKKLNRKPPPKPKPVEVKLPTLSAKPEAIVSKPKPKSVAKPTVQVSSKLRQWPLKGKTLARYGSTRQTSKLKWQGMMISAKVGQKVSAAAGGRVVFADWMRGFGSLLILDHGNNYMTLYGNNQALLRKAGDKVAVGDLLAYSGNDGIRPYAGLYFEVRKKGEPIDPVRWLK